LPFSPVLLLEREAGAEAELIGEHAPLIEEIEDIGERRETTTSDPDSLVGSR
jgi:hypothetical protein